MAAGPDTRLHRTKGAGCLTAVTDDAVLDFWTARDICEGDHEIHNPLSRAGLDLVTEHLDVRDGYRVLDVGCGNGWYLAHLATRWAVEGTGIDANPHFVRRARSLAVPAGSVLHFVEARADDRPVEPGSVDTFLCIGSTFAYGGYAPTLARAAHALRPGGRAAVGDLFRGPTQQIPDATMLGRPETMAEQLDHVIAAGLEVVAVFASDTRDWDAYESRIWQTTLRWADEHPDDARTAALLAELTVRREEYLRTTRPFARWAVLVARKPA